MSLSCGFIGRFFSGEQMDNITPVLEVESKGDKDALWRLTDGENTGIFAFKEASGPIENLHNGIRLILFEFYLTKNWLRRDRLGMIKRFDMYKLDSLVTSALCCSSTLNKAIQTAFIEYPELVEPSANTSICPQFSWALSRMGLYFNRFYQKEQQSPHSPSVARAISIITGTNLKTVYRHINKMPNPSPNMPHCTKKSSKKVAKRIMWENVASRYETFIQEKIRRSIHQRYREQNPINLVELIEEVGSQLADGPEKIEFKPSLSQMRLLLKGMGFRYEKIRGRPQIYESRELGEVRRKYLRKIRAYREAGFDIVYMDETWVWSGMKKAYEWVDQSIKENPFRAYKEFHTTGPKPSTIRGARAIVIGAINQTQIITETCKLFRGGKMEDGDYHKQMDSAIFENWLLQSIPHFLAYASGRKVVLIMDNAPYHSRKTTKVPTKSSRKKDMISFVENHGAQNIPYGLNKDEFFAFVEEFLKKNPHYGEKKAVEEICKESGIELLRLPAYHCLLNPIEMVWNVLKQKIRTKGKTNTKINDVIKMGQEILAEIPERIIMNCVQHVMEIEEWFWVSEGMQESIAPFIIPINDEDEDEEWDEESNEEVEWEESEESCEENDENIPPPSPAACPLKKPCPTPFY